MKGIFKRTIAAALGVLCAAPFAAMSQPDSQPVTVHAASVRTDSSGRKMEYLDRGVYVVNAGNAVFVSWRSLEEDPADCAFNLYRTTEGTTTKLNASPITGGTNYTDTTADQTKDNTYFVKMVTGGAETATDGSFTITTKVTDDSNCLGVDGMSKNEGANVLEWECAGTDDHKWIVSPKVESMDGSLIKALTIQDMEHYNAWGLIDSASVGSVIYRDRDFTLPSYNRF